MSILDLIQCRRSIRRYAEERVPEEVVAQVLEAARWAPSAHNRQPWRIARAATARAKQALAEAMATQLRRDRSADGDPPDAIEADAVRSVGRITGAPVVLVLSLTLADMDAYPDARRAAAEREMAVQSTAMAAQNMLLAATELGLGACWMCAPLFCPEVVRQALDLPRDWQPQALLTLGWPAKGGKPPSRRPLDLIVR
jgi:F420 biosynthesis protein FbiB-like protein